LAAIQFDDIDALNEAASEDFGPFGKPVHVSQEMIDAYADLVDDRQWIHIDVERCRRESPFGGTVAHGFLTLSLLPPLMRTVPSYDIRGHSAGVNYGAELVRFLSPVPAGSDIAARSRIVRAEPHKFGTLLTSEAAIHVVGAEKPSVLYRMQVLYRG
jgi:acyl dehydratase